MGAKFDPIFRLTVDYGDEGKETLCEARFERAEDSMVPKLVVSRGNDMKDITRSVSAMVAGQMSAALRVGGNRDGTVDLADYRPEHEEAE